MAAAFEVMCKPEIIQKCLIRAGAMFDMPEEVATAEFEGMDHQQMNSVFRSGHIPSTQRGGEVTVAAKGRQGGAVAGA